MSRLILRLAIVPLVLFSTALFLIRAQPYANRDVQDFLQSADCSGPCFMGIQPGITTPQQALNQLRASSWISRVGVSESLETVAWFWDKKQSTIMDDTQIPALFYDRDTVATIGVYTRVRLADVLLQLGEVPAKARVAIRRTIPYDTYNIDLYYLGDGFVLNAIVNCHHFWDQSTHLILGERPQFVEGQSRITTSLNDAKHQIAVACRRRNE